MNTTLKQQTISGMIWSAFQRFGSLSISLIANLVLARLLMPEDYGCVGILTVFIALSNSFMDGGFGAALIQKKNPTNIDYSTIFYWNLIFSIIIYFLLFFLAPFVAHFYKIPILEILLRVQGISIIFHAIGNIQNNQLQKQLNFRKIALINIISAVIGSIIGIILAIKEFGVWSLVWQILIINVTRSILLWYCNNWKPLKVFSWKSLKGLFSFGSLILLTSIVNTLYSNIVILIIGRIFSVKELGYYTQAKKLADLPSESLSTIVDQVTFPVFSKLQDNIFLMKDAVRKSLKSINFLTFPLMSLLYIIAEPLFRLLFTERWNDSVPFFQILCIAGLFYTMNTANTNIFKSLGRSDVYLLVQVIKRGIGLVNIIISLKFGIFGLVWAIAINAYLFFIINSIATKKLIDYGFIKQIKDIFPNLLISIFVAFITYILGNLLNIHYTLEMLLQIAFFLFGYIGLSILIKDDSYIIYRSTIVNIVTNFQMNRRS